MNLWKYIFFNILSLTFLFGWTGLPLEPNHPAQVYLRRQAALGNVPLSILSNAPISAIQTFIGLSAVNTPLSNRLLRDLGIPANQSGLIHPFNKNSISDIGQSFFKFNLSKPAPNLISIAQDTLTLWADWVEQGYIIGQDSVKTYYNDQLTVRGILYDKIYAYSRFTMHHISGEDPAMAHGYQNEWTKYFPDINKTFWYTSEASFYIKNQLFDIEIARTPYSWGWSTTQSPIIAAAAIPFSRISLYKNLGIIRLQALHGSLLANSIDSTHESNIKKEKYIAAHRLEWDMFPNMTVSFTEMALYGNRSPEIGYINPISLYWAQEHNLGDLDNILMAMDMAWRIRPGFIFYQTLLWDELSWLDLFKDWWGNKYAYQTGIFYAPNNIRLPDIRLEYTLCRPWLYTHSDFPYSHAGQLIGFPYGPSSRVLRLETFWFPTDRIELEVSLEKIEKGAGFGSDVSDNYDERDRSLDLSTPLLLKPIEKSFRFYVKTSVLITDMLNIRVLIYNDMNQTVFYNLGLGFDW